MQAIKKLKIRFTALAMISLTVLLAVIVTGMNIINYNKVVSDADTRLEVLEQNSDSLLNPRDNSGRFGGPSMFWESSDDPDDFDDLDDPDDIEDFFFGKGGKGGPFMTRDEAEESRFFMVTMNENGTVDKCDTGRISSVDAEEAAEYALKAVRTGSDDGFIDEFRFSINDDGADTKITFLDCGRVLESFRDFLRASIIMSLIGLLAVFVIISFFAGRIIKPVAESYEKQKRFITDAGHEIKTPLAIIKANLDLMNMELDDVAAAGANRTVQDSADTENDSDAAAPYMSLKDSLGDIEGQVDRLTGLTNDLVYLSRMEEDGSELVMTEVPLSDIVSETVSSFDALAKEQGRVIDTDIEPMVSAKGSNKELEKLVSILLENAIKYSSDKEPIRVSLKKDGKNTMLEVYNATDEDVSNDKLAHVFERFYRADESRNSAAGGHGIGLSMASAIVSAHNGRIAARTANGRDFIVTAAFPQNG